jgi:hypothetical protein
MKKALLSIVVALTIGSEADAQTVTSINGAPTSPQPMFYGWMSPPNVAHFALAPYQVFGRNYRRVAWVYVAYETPTTVLVSLWPENHSDFVPSTGGVVIIDGLRIVVSP